MELYDEKVLDAFLEKQLQLFPEPVADSREEAEEFLEDCMAVVLENMAAVREYIEEIADVDGMSDEELMEADEVFAVGDGRFLFVEG